MAKNNPRSPASGQLKDLQLDFWKGFKNYCANNNSSLPLQREPAPQHEYDISLGRRDVVLGLNARFADGQLVCEVYASGGNHKEVFHLLHKERDAIERELGEILWLPEASPNSIRIGRREAGFDLYDRSTWNAAYEWLQREAEAFYETFRKRVLKLPNWQHKQTS